MRRMIRFASTGLASLSLALIVLAATPGGKARAGIWTCGVTANGVDQDGNPTFYCNGSCLSWAVSNNQQCIPNGPNGFQLAGQTCNCEGWWFGNN